MEGKLNRPWTSALLLPAALLSALPLRAAQENAQPKSDSAAAEISLQKTIGARPYKGKSIEGDEREVRAGDSLWRILVKEKGVAEDRFKEYVVLIRGLNPSLKTPDVIRVGDRDFHSGEPKRSAGIARCIRSR